MAETTHIEVHRDHQHWLNDGALWRDQIILWKEESQQALADLTRWENALRQLVQSIGAHEQDVNQHLLKITAHQNALSEFEHTGDGDSLELLALAKSHRAEALNHVQQRDAHERLKKEHHTAMAQWNMLLRGLTVPAK